MSREDKYIKLIGELDERLSGVGPDDHLRSIAKQEAEKVAGRYVGLLFGIFLVAWLPDKLDVPAWVVWLTMMAVAVGWFVFTTGRDPESDRHLIVLHAEDMVRLQIVKEAFQADGKCWRIETDEVDPAAKCVVAIDGDRWNDFFERAYRIACSHEAESPKERKKQIERAEAEAMPAIRDGEALARQHGAKLINWAADCLHRQTQRR